MVLLYTELAILVRINAKMHYFEPEREYHIVQNSIFDQLYSPSSVVDNTIRQ